MNSSFTEHEADVLAAIGATTGGLSIFGGLLLLRVLGRHLFTQRPVGAHSLLHVKAILSRLGLLTRCTACPL